VLPGDYRNQGIVNAGDLIPYYIAVLGPYDIWADIYGVSAQEIVWDLSGGKNWDTGYAISRRGSALYVAGISSRPGHADDAVLLRYDAGNGTLKWVRYYDDPAHRNESVGDVLATSSGVYVCGSGKFGPVVGGDALLLKYSGAGGLMWSRYYGGSAGGFDMWDDLAAAPGGRVNVTGVVWKNATGDNVVTASYASSGALSWLRTFTTSGRGLDEGSSIAVDPATGDTYVGGSGERSATHEDALVICYSSSGATLWHTFWDGAGAALDDRITSIALTSGFVWATGSTASVAGSDDFLMLQVAR